MRRCRGRGRHRVRAVDRRDTCDVARNLRSPVEISEDPVGSTESVYQASADYPPDQAVMGKPVEAALFRIARCGGKHQCQIRGAACLPVSLLERYQQFVRSPDADKARRAQCVSVANDGNGLIGGDDLVLHRLQSLACSHCAMLLLRRPCDLLDTNKPTWPPGSGISV